MKLVPRRQLRFMGAIVVLGVWLSGCSSSAGETASAPVETELSSAVPSGGNSPEEPQPSGAVPESQCVDVNAENPSVQQLYEGSLAAALQGAVESGESEIIIDSMNETYTYEHAMESESGRNTVLEQESIIRNAPVGGYANFVRSFCEKNPDPSVARFEKLTPWGLVATAVTPCQLIATADQETKDLIAKAQSGMPGSNFQVAYDEFCP